MWALSQHLGSRALGMKGLSSLPTVGFWVWFEGEDCNRHSDSADWEGYELKPAFYIAGFEHRSQLRDQNLPPVNIF